jgi:hypothetical protein
MLTQRVDALLEMVRATVKGRAEGGYASWQRNTTKWKDLLGLSSAHRHTLAGLNRCSEPFEVDSMNG